MYKNAQSLYLLLRYNFAERYTNPHQNNLCPNCEVESYHLPWC